MNRYFNARDIYYLHGSVDRFAPMNKLYPLSL